MNIPTHTAQIPDQVGNGGEGGTLFWEMGDGRWEMGDGRWEIGGSRPAVLKGMPPPAAFGSEAQARRAGFR